MSCVSILKPDELERVTQKEHWSDRAVRWLNMNCFARASQSLAIVSCLATILTYSCTKMDIHQKTVCLANL